jgi:hypothetical protein
MTGPVCGKPQVKCSECPNQAFIQLGEQAILDHLRGRFTAGVYPLLPDDTCWFLAVDFDEESWKVDVAAFVKRTANWAYPWLSSAPAPVTAPTRGPWAPTTTISCSGAGTKTTSTPDCRRAPSHCTAQRAGEYPARHGHHPRRGEMAPRESSVSPALPPGHPAMTPSAGPRLQHAWSTSWSTARRTILGAPQTTRECNQFAKACFCGLRR